jgi:hypothetical protein
MASRAVLAAALLSVALPVLAQQPVYPNFPPPPAPSGENAPHTAPPDQEDQQEQQNYPDQQQYPSQTPQKPSPYPPDNGQPAPQQYPQQSAPSYPQNAPAYPQSAPSYPPPSKSLGWIPQGMEVMARTAAFHTDFTFDRSMLQLASGLWEGTGDQAFNDAVSRLDGIAVHSYHYAAPGMYDPRLLDAVRRQYSAMGWQHLVTAHNARSDGATDLWISFHHMHATGAVVLFQSATNVNLIAFSGNLSPLDLLHLRGHFGIPRFSGDHFVPAPGPAARVTPPPPRQ